MFARPISLLLVDPFEGFKVVKEKSIKSSIMVLAWCVALSAGLLIVYYHYVDFDWLVNQLLANTPSEQRASAAKFMTRTTMTIFGIVALVVMTPIVNMILAVYLFLVAKVKSIEIGFGKWFSLVAWSSVPTLLVLPIGIIAMLLGTGTHWLPETLNPTSLNQLFLHLSGSNPWKKLAESVSVLSLWSLALVAVGIKQWTSLSVWSAMAISAAPYVIFYGVWALIIMVSASS